MDYRTSSIVECSYRMKLLSSDIVEDVNYGIKRISKQLSEKFVEESKKWHVFRTASCFNRRVTCIEWQPDYPHLVAFGSHGGDIQLFNTLDSKDEKFIKGEGYGYGSITQMAFCPARPLHIYVTSVNGTFGLRDFEGKHSMVYLDSMDYRYWWTSLALSSETIFVGGNTGRAVLLDFSGNTLHSFSRLHKDKIHHAQFCPASEYILATSSNDKHVTLWDMRVWGDSENPNFIAKLKHEAPINSVYFDPLYGSRLLTTAQNHEIRLYDSHNWDTPTLVMKHSHRQFQHMTNIKATWHPLYEDLCIIGRYADSDDTDKTRCVDLIDLSKGIVAGQFYDPIASQIMTVNKFNKHGTILATGMGYSVLLWKLRDSSVRLNDTAIIPDRRKKRKLDHHHQELTSPARRNLKKKKLVTACTKTGRKRKC